MADENGPLSPNPFERLSENASEQHLKEMAELQAQRVRFEALYSSIKETHRKMQEQRRAAEEQGLSIDKLLTTNQQNAERIGALLGIAEMNERRLGNPKEGRDLEEGQGG